MYETREQNFRKWQKAIGEYFDIYSYGRENINSKNYVINLPVVEFYPKISTGNSWWLELWLLEVLDCSTCLWTWFFSLYN